MGLKQKIIGLIAVIVLLGAGLIYWMWPLKSLHELTMTINLNDDGSADIVETWDITALGGTEIYKEMRAMDGCRITDFIVTGDGSRFTTLSKWKTDASRTQKRNKAGLVQRGSGYELCFGIGQYGRHTYVMNYRIEGFVDRYYDIYGMNWQLVGSKMNVKPKIMKIQVFGDQLTAETEVYGFGYIGSIDVLEKGGKYYIEASNQQENGKYGKVNYVNILSGFIGAEFSSGNSRYSSRSFEVIAADAKKGSSYDAGTSTGSSGSSREVKLSVLMTVLKQMAIPLMLVLVLAVVGWLLYRKSHRIPKTYDGGYGALPRMSEVDYFRGIPCNKDIYLFYYIVKKVRMLDTASAQSGLINGILLNWIRQGRVEFVGAEKQALFSGRDTFKIHFINGEDLESPQDRTLYRYFQQAAGSNGILEDREFERWCKNHYTQMERWFTSIDKAIESRLKGRGYMEKVETIEYFLLIFRQRRYKTVYLEPFHDEVIRIIGFKKFLMEFGSLGDKRVKEVVLWEDYLIFAAVLGMADKVEQEVGRLYPELVEQTNINIGYAAFATQTFATRGIREMQTGIRAAKAREARMARDEKSRRGGGGSSSFGGGGSFFSGGGGGGVR